MSLPEITALCRVLARSNARDVGQMTRNLARLRELQNYLCTHSDPGTTACLEAATVLIEVLARGARIQEGDLLEIVCKLMASVEKHWTGPDPDAVIADALYGGLGPAEEGGKRVIRSSVHPGRSAVFGEGDVAEAQARIERLKHTPRINDMVLGELLVELGHLAPDDLQAALDEQMQEGALLGDVLVQRGLLERRTVEEVVDLQRSLRGERTRAALAGPPAPAPEPPPPVPSAAEERARMRAQAEARIGLRLDHAGRGPRGSVSLDDRSRDHLLGAILLRQGAVTSVQLEQALSIQRASGLRLGEALIDMESTTWEVINRAVELQKRLRQAAGLASWGRP